MSGVNSISSARFRSIWFELSSGRFASLSQNDRRAAVIEIGLEIKVDMYFYERDLNEIVEGPAAGRVFTFAHDEFSFTEAASCLRDFVARQIELNDLVLTDIATVLRLSEPAGRTSGGFAALWTTAGEGLEAWATAAPTAAGDRPVGLNLLKLSWLGRRNAPAARRVAAGRR